MSNYFRITGYYPKEDVCFIADSNGLYQEIWQFSSALLSKGIKIIAVSDETKFKDGNITRADQDTVNVIIRACAIGRPDIANGTIEINGKFYTPARIIG